VDDNEPWRRDFVDLLGERLGASVRFLQATSADDALVIATEEAVDVLVADLLLDESSPKESGHELLLELKNRNPRLEVIVLTQYGTVRSAVRCLKAGCFDYLEKPQKAVELAPLLARALSLSRSAVRRAHHIESLIHANWQMVHEADDAAHRGKYLESLMKFLFQTIPGWERIGTRTRNATEEIDLVITNLARDHFWHSYGSVILVECKNWQEKTPVGANELGSFHMKIRNRGGQSCRLGFFVSMSGVTRGFAAESSRKMEGVVVVALDAEDVWSLICASHRNQWLIDRVVQELVR
jgi:FixJ family two-component response regulator